MPLPLGLDVVRKDLGMETQRQIARVLKDSIEFALANRKDALEYALPYARGTTMERTDRFVAMYVNDRTVTLDEPARRAIEKVLEMGHAKKILPNAVKPEYIEPF